MNLLYIALGFLGVSMVWMMVVPRILEPSFEVAVQSAMVSSNPFAEAHVLVIKAVFILAGFAPFIVGAIAGYGFLRSRGY